MSRVDSRVSDCATKVEENHGKNNRNADYFLLSGFIRGKLKQASKTTVVEDR